MRVEGTPQTPSTAPQPDPAGPGRLGDDDVADDDGDGDFPIEGDPGTVDTGGQAQVPPPRPPGG